jgi:hypothetical protein
MGSDRLSPMNRTTFFALRLVSSRMVHSTSVVTPLATTLILTVHLPTFDGTMAFLYVFEYEW